MQNRKKYGLFIYLLLFLMIIYNCNCYSQLDSIREAFPQISEAFQPVFTIMPPHCTKASVIKSTSSKGLSKCFCFFFTQRN